MFIKMRVWRNRKKPWYFCCTELSKITAVVGHVPRLLSSIGFLLIMREAQFTVLVLITADHPQGGMKIPHILTFN